MLYLSLLTGSHYQNFRNGLIFSGIVRRQDRTEETKKKVYIFVYKIFTNSFFKSYTEFAM